MQRAADARQDHERAVAAWSRHALVVNGARLSVRTAQNTLLSFNAGFPLLATMTVFLLAGSVWRDSLSISDFLTAFRAEFALSVDEVHTAGEWDIERGAYTITLTSRSGGSPIDDSGKYITIYHGDMMWMGTDGAPQNMKAGGKVEVEISGIGVLRNYVVAGE